jgi:hypothetical protein
VKNLIEEIGFGATVLQESSEDVIELTVKGLDNTNASSAIEYLSMPLPFLSSPFL